MKKINIFPLKIKTFTLGNIINDNIDCFLFGNNISNSFNFLYYFTFNINSLNNNDENNNIEIEKNNKFIKYWNYLPNKEINYILPSNNDNNNFIYIFDSQLSKLNLDDNNNYENKILIDDEIYISPSINNNKIFGIINYQGLKIYNLENNNYNILYPGKKNTIYDYSINNNNNSINLIVSTSDKKMIIYDFRDKKSEVSFRHKFAFDKILFNNNNIICYSSDIEKILLYDVRNINKYKDIIKENVNINKMILNDNNNLFYWDLNLNNIININIENKIEKYFEYDFNNDNNDINNKILNFDFDITNKNYFYIQNSYKEIFLFNIKNN